MSYSEWSKAVDGKDIVSQSSDEDIDLEEQQENTMYNRESLVERQQRHFNSRLQSAFWTKDDELLRKHTYKVPSYTNEVNFNDYNKDKGTLVEAKKKAEDIIMLGDPIKMFEALDAFQKITIH